MTNTDLGNAYKKLYDEILCPIAIELELYLSTILSDVPHIDRVATRAKSPTRFADKALKVDDYGNLKYTNPLLQIQDQIGARVTVLYLSDVKSVKNAIENYLVSVEWAEKQPESDMEFGYFGEHYVIKIPDDAIPEGMEERAPEFFELQIKTLFQHAWSEASHDIAYKAPRDLTSLENRQLAFSAAQAWGADQIFAEIAKSLASNDDDQSA